MASIASMEAQVREQERINSELRSELYQLESGIASAQKSWDELSQKILGTLSEGNSRLEQSQDLTLRTQALESEIEQAYALFKNMEHSNKMIRECNNKIYYDFADYTRVRKIVEGLLNNLETAFVSDEALLKAIEVQHLKLPDYWLTCAMLALMAWRNDDRPMAEMALERACLLDQKATSIFFFAMYLRMGRYSAALKWFDAYTRCERTGDDNRNILFMFSILTKNAGNVTDEKVFQSIEQFVQRLIRERLESEGYSEADMVKKIRWAYNAMIVNEPLAYPLLAANCTDSDLINGTLQFAKNNSKILEFIRTTIHVTERQKHDRIGAFIDDVIRRANTTEVEVRNEIRYHETVIRMFGNVEAARAEHAEWLRHNHTELDIISEMVNWLYYPQDEEVSADERARFFVLTKELSRKAVGEYADNYRRQVRDMHPVTIGDYSAEANLKTPGADDANIEAFFHAREQEELSQQKIWSAFVGFGAALLGIIGAVAMGQPALLVVTAAGAVFGLGKLLLTKRAKAEIMRRCGADIVATERTLREMQTEYAAYLTQYEAYDAVMTEIGAEFEKL